jgi:hypothetical protein
MANKRMTNPSFLQILFALALSVVVLVLLLLELVWIFTYIGMAVLSL